MLYLIFKNLWTSLRRYPVAVMLDVAGLAVAFTAFMIILIQVSFERGYDSWIPDPQCVYRVEIYEEGDAGADYEACLNHLLCNELTDASAHVTAGSLMEQSCPKMDLAVDRPNGRTDLFTEPAVRCTPALFEVLGIRMVEGDTSGLESGTGMVIPRSTARRIFGNESAVGRQLRMTGLSKVMSMQPGEQTLFTVSGVYEDFPANSIFDNVLFWGHPWYNSFDGNYNYMLFVRINAPEALAEVDSLMNARIRALFDTDRCGVRLVNVRDIYYENDVAYEFFTRKGTRATGDILLAIAVLVILIASINYVNFASALMPVRMKLINLQKILGAGVWPLRLSLVAESAVIALAAYGVALAAVACLAGTPLADYVDADLSLAANLPLAGRCALLALGVGVAAGLYPAFYMTSFRPILAVKGTFGSSTTGRRYRMALVGIQYMISIGLIIAAIFVNLQNRYLQRFETGYDRDRVVIVTLQPGAWQRRGALVDELKADAAIEEVAFAYQQFGREEQFMGWGRGYRDNEQISYQVLLTTPEFPRVIGVEIAEGRDFTPSDVQRAPCSYLFNDTARRMFGMHEGDYVSQNDLYDGAHVVGWGEVVGFLPAEFCAYSRHKAEEPFALCCLGTINYGDLTMPYCYVRIADGAESTAAIEHIRQAAKRISTAEPDVEFLDTAVESLYRRDRKTAVLVTLFSLLAIAVSLMGIFGLVLFETQHRRKEIGIRKVAGATSASILAMFNGRFTVIVLASFVVAAPLAWYGVSEWLHGFVSGVGMQGWVFAAALAIVLAITVTTVTLRSWQAANENPVDSVKTE